MKYLTSEQRTIAAQRERIAELEESLRQANERLCPPTQFPLEWRLTKSQCLSLAALYAAPGVLSKERIFELACSETSEIKTIDVHICMLRKKLTPFGVEIDTWWGRGYHLPPTSKAIIRAALEQRAAA